MIRKLSTKDRTNFLIFCNQQDKHSDFYITKNNQRLFLTDWKVGNNVFNGCLKRGDKCLIKDEGGIQGVLIINGFADKFSRKYMKVLANNLKTADELVWAITWDFQNDIYIKIKNDNPIAEILLGSKIYNKLLKKNSSNDFRGYGFRLLGERTHELLFFRKYNEKFDYSKKPIYVKEGDEE